MTSGETLADVSVAWPAWSEVLRVLTFRAGYNSAVVLAGATLLGLAAGVIGTFSVLRKRALVSDALAHSALPGIALAFLWGVYWQSDARRVPLLLLGAAISGVLGILCIQIITRTTRLREDTAIGAVLSVFFGVGVVLLSFIQSLGTGQEGGLHHLIYGQTAALRLADAHLTMIVASLIVIIAALCIKEFRLICFDAEFAGAQGWSVSKIDLLMMGSIVLVTVVGLIDHPGCHCTILDRPTQSHDNSRRAFRSSEWLFWRGSFIALASFTSRGGHRVGIRSTV